MLQLLEIPNVLVIRIPGLLRQNSTKHLIKVERQLQLFFQVCKIREQRCHKYKIPPSTGERVDSHF